MASNEFLPDGARSFLKNVVRAGTAYQISCCKSNQDEDRRGSYEAERNPSGQGRFLTRGNKLDLVVTFRNSELVGVVCLCREVKVLELLAQIVQVDPNRWIFLGVERGILPKELHRDGDFLWNLTSDGLFEEISKKLLKAFGFLKFGAFQDLC